MISTGWRLTGGNGLMRRVSDSYSPAWPHPLAVSEIFLNPAENISESSWSETEDNNSIISLTETDTVPTSHIEVILCRTARCKHSHLSLLNNKPVWELVVCYSWEMLQKTDSSLLENNIYTITFYHTALFIIWSCVAPPNVLLHNSEQ